MQENQPNRLAKLPILAATVMMLYGATLLGFGSAAAETPPQETPLYDRLVAERPEWYESPDVAVDVIDGVERFTADEVTWWLDEGQVFFRFEDLLIEYDGEEVLLDGIELTEREGTLFVREDGGEWAPVDGASAAVTVERIKTVTWRYQGVTINNQDPGLARVTNTVLGPYGDKNACKFRFAWPPYKGSGHYDVRSNQASFEGENSRFTIERTKIKEYGYSATGTFLGTCSAKLVAARYVAVGKAHLYSLTTFPDMSGSMSGWTHVSGVAFGGGPTVHQKISTNGWARFSGGLTSAGSLTLYGQAKIFNTNTCIGLSSQCLTAT